MTLAEPYRLVLAFVRVLYVNGQATDETVDAGERLARAVGLRAAVLARWGELQLQGEDGDAVLPTRAVAADPAGVNMARVVAAMRAIEDVAAHGVPPANSFEA